MQCCIEVRSLCALPVQDREVTLGRSGGKDSAAAGLVELHEMLGGPPNGFEDVALWVGPS